jgi:uncharacterized protein
MKRSIVLVSLFAAIAFSCGRNNEVSETVFDNEEILTAKQERYLASVISDYERKTTKEIIVLTSKDLGNYDDSWLYAADFGNTHGVNKNGQDNGLVIYVSKNLSKTALSTGYGFSKSLPYETCRKIVDSCMIPQFKEDKYFDGLKAGLDACIKNWK